MHSALNTSPALHSTPSYRAKMGELLGICHHLLSSSPSTLTSLALLTLLLSISVESCLILFSLNPVLHLLPITGMLALLALQYLLIKPHHIYLVDFACLKPPSHLRVPTPALLEHLSLIDCFDKDSVSFMARVITSSGLGEETYFPPSLRYIPPRTDYDESIKEAHMLLFPVLDDLFSRTHITPLDVDVLVVNCSGFCSSPSLSSIVVNHYRMREDIRNFNVSGMGCSAGAVSVDIAKTLLSVNHASSSYAVVLSTELLSTGWYSGTDRRKLLLNCVFRMGSAAMLLTSNRMEAKKIKPKYKLVRVVRTQRAFDDAAYRSASKEEDSQGITGFSIERDLLRVARETLRSNVMALGASILPLHEKLRYLVFCLRRLMCTKASSEEEDTCFVPNFGSAIQHYCIPASGKAVIREIGKGLGLRERDVEPAAAAFHRFGNQSSSSMWYQTAYLEAKGRVRKGDRVWQLGMGSGPKANTLVWECVREIAEEAVKGPWRDCIDEYPLCDGDRRKS